jgi:hypothetical protein
MTGGPPSGDDQLTPGQARVQEEQDERQRLQDERQRLQDERAEEDRLREIFSTS